VGNFAVKVWLIWGGRVQAPNAVLNLDWAAPLRLP